ncbi:hypothetical protein [Amycolatopsis sp. WQ 127309]|uniref:hypothetical protein n=1 Tax=Amycolatopsis sp. WQ 127309 TaxID=2932773 RepID=UPI001FF5DA6B|nr:hypothetical protein [Amycolatopsis sp. WQ 127309]UOZ03296.1 hypothetical protein MUY22_31115 [Amycolatopsis sp. WQ 127309]
MGKLVEELFASEVEMLLPLARATACLMPPRIVGGDWSAMFEVPAGDGVADLCAVRFARGHRDKRGGRPAITDWTDVRVFAVLQHPDKWTSVAELAALAGLTVDGLRRGPLRRLTEAGHVRRTADGGAETEWQYSIPVTGVTAVEAKLSDWHRALVQARRHTVFADASYIALPPRVAARAADATEMLASSQVGVLSVRPSGEVRVVREAPRPRRIRGWALRRMFAAERLWALHSAGAVSGPVRHVFGRPVLASPRDPRSSVAVLN